MSPAREKSIEVTAEDAAAMVANSSPSSSSSHRPSFSSGHSVSSISVKKKLTKFIKPMGKSLRGVTAAPRSDFSARDGDNNSYNSESIGQMSATPTVASVDTIKISNRQQQAQGLLETPKGKKTPWKKLKKFMGLPPSNNSGSSNSKTKTGDGFSISDAVAANGTIPRRTHSKSVDFKLPGGSADSTTSRRRVSSMDSLPKLNSGNKKQQQEPTAMTKQSMLDDAVRGRLDGIDLLYLGPAYLISLERKTNAKDSASSSTTPWEPAAGFSFAGRSTQYTTQEMVTDMMQLSSPGQERPDIILEGFFRDDRWIVTLDQVPNKKKAKEKRSSRTSNTSGDNNDKNNNILVEVDNHSSGPIPDGLPPLQLTDEEDHSHSTVDEIIPRHKLWPQMWGPDTKPPPKPSHMTSVDDVDPDSDSILEMAASCSVPIDVDEDTFMISNAQHLQAVHDLASVPLQHGQFDEAMAIFKRILRGIEIQETDALRHLEGVTLHNMAVLFMWQESYEQALDMAGKAIIARLQYLPEGHPDIAVSLVRQGYAYFALQRYDLAEASFHAALEKLTEDNVVKAKVLSNLGVAQYQRGDDIGALKNFTNALEIQRLWLQGPVRREATVFGAAVMLGNMGKIHIKRGDYDLAVSVYEEALLLQTTIFGSDHDLVLATLVSLALAWAFNSQPLKAGQILNGVLRSQLSHLGPATTPVVETTGAIGNLHFGLGNYEDALKCFAPVLKWQKANLEAEHSALRKTKDILKRIKKSAQAVWV